MNPTTIRSRCGQLVGDSVTNITSAFEASFAVTQMTLGIPWFFLNLHHYWHLPFGFGLACVVITGAWVCKLRQALNCDQNPAQ